MATLQEIIDFLDRKLPNHGELDANIVLDLQDIHLDIYTRLQRLSNKYETYQKESVAEQLHYSLPDYIKIENIIEILVSTTTQGIDFDTYSYRGTEDYNAYGNFYGRATNGLIFIKKDLEALQTTGLKININYFRYPTTLTSVDLTQVPELDANYHELLKYRIVSEIAAQGHNPDVEIADYWRSRYDEKFRTVMSDIESNLQHAYTKSPEQRERW